MEVQQFQNQPRKNSGRQRTKMKNTLKVVSSNTTKSQVVRSLKSLRTDHQVKVRDMSKSSKPQRRDWQTDIHTSIYSTRIVKEHKLFSMKKLQCRQFFIYVKYSGFQFQLSWKPFIYLMNKLLIINYDRRDFHEVFHLVNLLNKW